MDHGARRGCGAAVPEPGAGEAMALREEEEGGEGNGGDKPVAANLRVVTNSKLPSLDSSRKVTPIPKKILQIDFI